MEIKLGIRDFQAIVKAKLSFVPGITLITGPNGSGKTAIMRALYALIKNPRMGRSYIKGGAKETTVVLQIDQGDPIAWTKSLKETIYRVGKQVYHKSGNSQIYDILPDFPFVTPI